MTDVTCSVCGATVGRGPQGLGLISHSLRHRREFRETFGRPPEDYAEVREKLRSGIKPNQQTLWEALTDDDQLTIREVDQ